MTVGSHISRHASARATDNAFSCDGQTINWNDLELLLRRIGEWITSNAPLGRSVAIDLPNSAALALVFLSAIRTGREAIVLDTQWPRSSKERIVGHMSPDLTITFDHLYQGSFCLHLPIGSLGLSGLQKYFAASKGLQSWPTVDPEGIFYTGFTSGTTGSPKGYRRTHRSWTSSFEAARDEFPLNSDDIVLAPGSLTHSLPLFAMAYAMSAGAHFIMMSTFRPDRLLAEIVCHRASVLFAVPSQIGFVTRMSMHPGLRSCGSVRWLICSGEKWHGRGGPEMRGLFPMARFADFYGSSEASFISIAHESESVPEGSVGRLFVNVEVRIAGDDNPENGSFHSGRIFVRSPMLFSNYTNTDINNVKSSDGFVAVDDHGYQDAAGWLFLTGRHNRMIVVSGKNVFPEEIESIIEAYKPIAYAAVFALADDKRGERPVAVIALDENAGVTRSEIIKFLRKHLPLYKIPRAYAVARKWPVTPSGKTDFQTLSSLWQEKQLERLP